MVRKKRRYYKTRSRRTKIKLDPGVTTYRFKYWQTVRVVRMAQTLGKQNLVEDALIDWLAEHNAPVNTIDYYLGYAKRAEELAERFKGYPLELALDEIKREAVARGLDPELIEYCIYQGGLVANWVEYASYYDRNGLASRDFPEAGGAFCSLPDSIPLVSPERFYSDKVLWLYRVAKRARIFAEDLNVILIALLYAIYLTPALRIYYFPFAYLGPAIEIEEIPRPPALLPPEEIPEPWSILMKRYNPKDLIFAEDVNDILEIAEILRIYWAPDLPSFPTRFLPGDCLRSDLYNEIITLLEGILYRIPPAPVEWIEIIPPAPGPSVSPGPSGPSGPVFSKVMTEDWGYGGLGNMGKVKWENWCYSDVPIMSQKFKETWSS